MAKNLKINIQSAQLAKALKLKSQLGKAETEKEVKKRPLVKPATETETEPEPKKRAVRARTRSAFAPKEAEGEAIAEIEEAPIEEPESVFEVLPTLEEAESPVIEKPAAEEIRETPVVEVVRPAAPATVKPAVPPTKTAAEEESAARAKEKKRRTFRDLKPKHAGGPRFDSRDKQGLRAGEEESWRKRRPSKGGRGPASMMEEAVVRPQELSVRIPITVKDLAAAMKLKASQLISTLFMQGVVKTLNDILDDATTIQLLGHEFGCAIRIDTSEEERVRITGLSIKEELDAEPADELQPRAPVVTFMGHVDHGKTSLIDRIRQTNVAASEAGAITQHIGAFQTQTRVGPITILDTPGHEAFTAMRARGADVTDVVVLVVAGDEGIRAQTLEAVQHARAAHVTIMVAINKCDKPNFNAENVYRQLAEVELMPEQWGGSIVCVNCSAVSGQGVEELLEMIALQAEVLELKANPHRRARGTVLESEMHKGLGAVATVLVQNGSLKRGDSVVFDDLFGRVKTMQDEFGHTLNSAGPAMPIAITGLSGLPEAGSEFIVVSSEKEAREIAEARREGRRERALQKKRRTMEHLLEEAAATQQKQLNVILRADVQGSLEALKQSLEKIQSDKAKLEVIFAGVGAISESDVELAIASHAVIIGFHTSVESHADNLVRAAKIQVRLHNIIYHAVDDVRDLLAGKLEKVAEEHEKGLVEVRATFKASQLGTIAGCIVKDGLITRNSRIRQVRDGEVIWKGGISSLKREKDDTREVKAGLECGVLLDGQNDVKVGDQFQAYEVVYVTQGL